ncbi:MAG: hypothetical protein Q9172_000235 [Xanthocarpia lactea]
MLCRKSKPPFAQKRRGIEDEIEDGALEEVVLAGADGEFPGSSPSLPREVLTARGWDEEHYFWVLDRGSEKFIMKAFEGAYRRCLGINDDMKAIYEKNIFAYPVPDSPSRPSSPTAPNSDLDIVDLKATTSRKRRLSHNQGGDSGRKKPSASVGPFTQGSTNQKIIEKDRLYYDQKNQRPPYVQKPSPQFVAVVTDQNGKRTEQQFQVKARHWSDGFQYWVADIGGHERIVNRWIGGSGGYRLRLWPGPEKHEQGDRGALVGLPTLQTERDHSGQFARSETSIQKQTDRLSRASSVPHTRRTRDRLQAVRTKQHSALVHDKARSPNGTSRKSPGTVGYNGSPLVGQTPSGIVPRTPAVDGNERSTRPPLSASEQPAIESTDGVSSVIPVPTNNGVSPVELLRQKRDFQRKLLLLEMQCIDDQLKEAGVVV